MTNNIVSAYFMLTDDCNLACTYCFEKDIRNKKKMTKEIAFKAVDFLLQNASLSNEKNIHITFFGGEPTLNIPVMKEILEYTYEKTKDINIKALFSIITNATIYNKKLEDVYLLWYKLHGNLNIQLSIDGNPATQDKGRITKDGSGSSSLIESTVPKYLEFLDRNNINRNSIHIHACISKDNLPSLRDNYKYLCNLIQSNKVGFMPVIEENWDDNDINIMKNQLKLIGDDMLSYCLRVKNDNFFKTNILLKEREGKSQKQYSCTAGKKLVCITANGDIYPCHRFYSFSKKTDTDLKIGTIYSGIDNEKIKPYAEIRMKNMTVDGNIKCNSCQNVNCKICIATNFEMNNNIAAISPYYCKFANELDFAIKKTIEYIKGALYKNSNDFNNSIIIELFEKMNKKIEKLESQNTDIIKKLQEENDFLKHIIIKILEK